jgi:hypothetical protein
VECLDLAADRGGHFDRGLIGFEFEHGLVGLDHVADGDQHLQHVAGFDVLSQFR